MKAGLKMKHHSRNNRQKGFSLLELMVSVAILVIVAGTVMMGMIRMTWSESTIMNRTQMHSSVRNATELMQQDIGQAGRLGSAPGLQMTTAVAGGTAASTVTLTTTSTGTNAMSPTDDMYAGEQLVIDPSTTNEETVTITAKTATTITAVFANAHTANVPVLVLGGFASGIVPPDTSSMYVLTGNSAAHTTLTTGTGGTASTGSVLKLYGDINGDGTSYYVTYTCNQANGTLYRYISDTNDVNTATAITYTLLLDNLGTNPPTNSPAPCFTYTTKDVPVTLTGGSQVTETFVTNVAVTLTVNTQNKDLQTGQLQKETKALLNIAPRNVSEAWQLAGSPSGYTRAQPMPDNVVTLLSKSLPK